MNTKINIVIIKCFCSRSFAFMALIVLKTRTLCKMHDSQKMYDKGQGKTKSGKGRIKRLP